MKTESSIQSCHVCGGELREFTDFREFRLVSSDCQPLNVQSSLCICNKCGTVQKEICDEWLECVNQVYRRYNVYSQAAGKEQRAFDASNGLSSSRSSRILEWIKGGSRHHQLKPKGSILDFGCGNGNFLREFQQAYPGWHLTGLEIDDSNKLPIESIPNTKHVTGTIDSLEESYDIISMVHVLEHLVDPISLLAQLRKRLKPGGMLFVEVPNLITSPFDLFILDHCTHLTLESLRWILWKGGFQLIDSSTEVIAKEITLVAVTCAESDGDVDVEEVEAATAIEVIGCHLALARRLKARGSELIAVKPAIFGSSISATWLANELGFNVSLFIEEDNQRIGNHHCGIPILSLADVPPSTPLLLPFSDPTAEIIRTRLGINYPMIHTIPAY